MLCQTKELQAKYMEISEKIDQSLHERIYSDDASRLALAVKSFTNQGECGHCTCLYVQCRAFI